MSLAVDLLALAVALFGATLSLLALLVAVFALGHQLGRSLKPGP